MWRVIEPDLACDQEPLDSHESLAVAPDGGAWYLDKVRGIRELGSCSVLGPRGSFRTRAQALAPDGTVWVLDELR